GEVVGFDHRLSPISGTQAPSGDLIEPNVPPLVGWIGATSVSFANPARYGPTLHTLVTSRALRKAIEASHGSCDVVALSLSPWAGHRAAQSPNPRRCWVHLVAARGVAPRPLGPKAKHPTRHLLSTRVRLGGGTDAIPCLRGSTGVERPGNVKATDHRPFRPRARP